jgi:hypothetical protein
LTGNVVDAIALSARSYRLAGFNKAASANADVAFLFDKSRQVRTMFQPSNGR